MSTAWRVALVVVAVALIAVVTILALDLSIDALYSTVWPGVSGDGHPDPRRVARRPR